MGILLLSWLQPNTTWEENNETKTGPGRWDCHPSCCEAGRREHQEEDPCEGCEVDDQSTVVDGKGDDPCEVVVVASCEEAWTCTCSFAVGVGMYGDMSERDSKGFAAVGE